MKHSKIIVGVAVIGIVVILIVTLRHNDYENTTFLLEMDAYKNIKLEDIKQINILSYTEGGSESVLEEDDDSIKKTYNYLANIRVGKETQMSCDDNTKVYMILLESNEEINITIECDWLIIDNKRYNIVK